MEEEIVRLSFGPNNIVMRCDGYIIQIRFMPSKEKVMERCKQWGSRDCRNWKLFNYTWISLRGWSNGRGGI